MKQASWTQTSWTIWFTGLHGAGKTTIANSLAEKLRSKNIPVVVLDGDEVRENISFDLGYSIEDRNSHMKRIAGICRILNNNNILAIACVASPTESSREYAKNIIGNLFLVYVDCPLEICEQRDVKGHYKKAREREEGFENFLGIATEYEPPNSPDLTLKTNEQSVEKSVNKLIRKLEERGILKFQKD